VQTIYDGLAGVKSEIDEGVASPPPPPPPVRPLELAALAAREFADLLDKYESRGSCTNKAEGGGR
jgi:hypothetical protein